MWAKNILIYRRPERVPADIEAQLAKHPPVKPGALDWFTQGWVSPAPFRDEIAPSFGGFRVIKLRRDDKVLPAPVIKAALRAKVADVERREHRKVGRKEQRELKGQVTDELLAKAMTKDSYTTAWMNDEYLFIDAGSANKGETVLSALNEAMSPFVGSRLNTHTSPTGAMTAWIRDGEAPGDFVLDSDCALEDPATGAKVTVKGGDLTAEEVRKHIEAGMVVKSVGLIWRNRVKATLTDKLQVKRLKFLEIVQEDVKEAGDDADAVFEATFRAMSGELSALVADLVSALGGFQEGGDE
ncbi:recombination-associated protein RdgC [Paraburkholderia aspalathi]|nr:recombination-associated protein RdgC [Paraburkholderia aspalathi]MBK3780218.1 recombination-associated protein RdgC [Paraburkholderia aspalathi]